MGAAVTLAWIRQSGNLRS